MRLTTDEIKLLTFVLVAVIAGAATKYYRNQHPRPLISTPVPAQGTVTPAGY
ncbi:MAG: hypothetical protein JWQ44_2148 [Chthoniobacter sp.]|jgi:hypothetical protein|nr:hypothetical protein [Chthoniobacter sp.]